MSNTSDNKPVGYFLERTTRIVKLQFHKSFKELGVDMTPEQWVVMDILSKQTELSQRELAGDSFKDAPTISRIIDVLSKKTWVQRTPSLNDRRVYNISLTKEGKAIYNKCIKVIMPLREKGWEGLSPKDYQEFTRIVNKIFENYS